MTLFNFSAAITKLHDESLNDLFVNSDFPKRVIEGGWELLFRDRLLRRLRAEESELRFERETIVLPGRRKDAQHEKIEAKKADIAVFAIRQASQVFDRRNPDGIVEIKHNFATQPQVFTGLETDIEKWRGWKQGEPEQGGPKRVCELQFIQIITDIKRLRYRSEPVHGRSASGAGDDFSDSLCKDIFKYAIQRDEKKRSARMTAVTEYFKGLQKGLDESQNFWSTKFSVEGHDYFGQAIEFLAEVHIFVLCQGASVSSSRKFGKASSGSGESVKPTV